MFKNRTAACAAFTDAATVQCTQHDGWAYEDWEQQKQAFITECEAKLPPGETVAFSYPKASGKIVAVFSHLPDITHTVFRPSFARQRTGKFRTKGARYTFEFLHTTGKVETSEGLVKSLSLTSDSAGLEFTNAAGARMVYSLPTDHA